MYSAETCCRILSLPLALIGLRGFLSILVFEYTLILSVPFMSWYVAILSDCYDVCLLLIEYCTSYLIIPPFPYFNLTWILYIRSWRRRNQRKKIIFSMTIRLKMDFVRSSARFENDLRYGQDTFWRLEVAVRFKSGSHEDQSN